MILPALNTCKVCHQERPDYAGSDLEYKHDGSRPEWHGWHGLSRGLATILNQLGIDDSVIPSILGHSHVPVTQACYIKIVPQQATDAMNRLETLLCADRAPESTTKDAKLLN